MSIFNLSKPYRCIISQNLHICYVSYLNNIRWRIQIIKLIIINLSLSCYFLSLFSLPLCSQRTIYICLQHIPSFTYIYSNIMTETMTTDRKLWITWIQSLWNIWRTIWLGHLIRICTGHHSLCAIWSKNHSQAACDALNCFVNSSTHCTIVGWNIMSELQKFKFTKRI